MGASPLSMVVGIRMNMATNRSTHVCGHPSRHNHSHPRLATITVRYVPSLFKMNVMEHGIAFSSNESMVSVSPGTLWLLYRV